LTASRCFKSILKGASLVLLLLLLMVASAAAQTRPPNLIVLVVAEQFRADYLDLLRPEFSRGGFERLLTQGAVYRRCRFDHLTTLAAPNAATLATGAYPEIHGIVAERWFDRETHRLMHASGREAEIEGAESVPISPRRLQGSTFADELRLATSGGSRVLAISDRASPAVLLAGRQPIGCYWRGSGGAFETSAYYKSDLPPWVEEFNSAQAASRQQERAWVALRSPEGSDPLRVLRAPDPATPESLSTLYRASPFAVAETFAFAERAIEAERLGQGTYTDFLVINISAPALLGLETWAESPLMRDLVLQLDRMLENFLGAIEKQVSLDKTLLVFTASHGLSPLPEQVRALGLSAGRVSGDDVVRVMNEALAAGFGPGVFVEKYVYPFVYLSAETHRRPAEARIQIIKTAGEAARGVLGVAGYYSPEASSVPPAFEQRLRRSWFAGRSGDFLLTYDPYFVEYYGDGRGTAPGSMYRYDTDVPLIFFGKPFKTAHFAATADATSVAPTLSIVAGIPAPSSATGVALTEAIMTTPLVATTPPAPAGSRSSR
jgi:arylsulfatase A-like enzyme